MGASGPLHKEAGEHAEFSTGKKTSMKRTPAHNASQLRIIGGAWRGRKLTFTERPGLRPTGDRVRETLFNWLAPYLHGARCLDLFAGSGALGMEALSRGAEHCEFVDSDRQAVTSLKANLTALGSDCPAARAQVTLNNAQQFLSTRPAEWHIVFVDPPFGQGLAEPALNQLIDRNCLARDSWVYFETRQSQPEPIPEHRYTVHREKTAGDVLYRLLAPVDRN